MVLAKSGVCSKLDSMYTEIILEHYRNPANFGIIPNADLESYDENPICGDKIKMQIKLSGSRIKDAKFSGDGCAICIASASMLTSYIIGKNLGDVKKISKEDIFGLLKIDLTPIRIKCALLSLKVLKMSLVTYLKDSKSVNWNSL